MSAYDAQAVIVGFFGIGLAQYGHRSLQFATVDRLRCSHKQRGVLPMASFLHISTQCVTLIGGHHTDRPLCYAVCSQMLRTRLGTLF